MGKFSFTVTNIIKEKKKKFKLYKNNKSTGEMFVKAIMTHKGSFLEYLEGGTQINLMIGIDFTGSNGNPNSP